MKGIILRLIAYTLAVFFTAWILGDAIYLKGFTTAILVAIVLALLNVTIKPLLIFFTLPATVVSLGLFLFVINAVVIMAADNLISGFEVRNFWWALLFSLLLSFVNSLLQRLGEDPSREPRS
jgi:putative membrane protein